MYPQYGNVSFTPYPYAPPMMPQIQPQIQRNSLYGKEVTKVEDITPNDVPMDGTAGLFPMKDDSAIYKKYWDSEGNIKTIKFVPVEMEEPTVEQINEMEELKSWMNEKFESLAKSLSSKSTSKASKEEIK